MIRQLRRWHRAWFTLLAVLLPALLLLALRHRPQVPRVEAFPQSIDSGLVDSEPVPATRAQSDAESGP